MSNPILRIYTKRTRGELYVNLEKIEAVRADTAGCMAYIGGTAVPLEFEEVAPVLIAWQEYYEGPQGEE